MASKDFSSADLRAGRSIGKKTIVVAREKSTQTPASYLKNNKTLVFLNEKHSDLMTEQKR